MRILAGDVEVRVLEVTDRTALYGASDMAADWPDEPPPGAVAAVAEWGAGFGWGVEARVPLAA